MIYVDSAPALTWSHVFAAGNFRDDVGRAQDQYNLEGFSAYGRLACAWLSNLLDSWDFLSLALARGSWLSL